MNDKLKQEYKLLRGWPPPEQLSRAERDKLAKSQRNPRTLALQALYERAMRARDEQKPT